MKRECVTIILYISTRFCEQQEAHLLISHMTLRSTRTHTNARLLTEIIGTREFFPSSLGQFCLTDSIKYRALEKFEFLDRFNCKNVIFCLTN